jgi:hypothetical protein
MKKTLLQEVKAMNRIAGTELTKEQEISLIKERLQQLNELEFGTQKAFDAYQKQHDMRGSTQVTVAGKKMSVSQAAKQSKDPAIKGSSVFGNNKGGEVFGKKSTSTDDDDDTGVGWGPGSSPEEKERLNQIGQLSKVSNKVEDYINKVSGGSGYSQVNDDDVIEYNMAMDSPTYTMYIGNEDGEHRVSINSTYGNDPAKIDGKIDKSFNNPNDAMKFAGDIAKKYKKQLEMVDED